MIVSVTLNAAIDHILVIDGLKPHDTNRVVQMQTDAGGKGINLSRVAVEMGATSVATGFVCGGPGAFIKYILDRDGVKHEFVETQGETRTISMSRAAMDHPRHLTRVGLRFWLRNGKSSWRSAKGFLSRPIG
ncbi:PfkB family carbohydrate kinase [Geitlerinema splendidum]|nr:PfkB family carbohydrate kinase [Geitlerinema splendidum]